MANHKAEVCSMVLYSPEFRRINVQAMSTDSHL